MKGFAANLTASRLEEMLAFYMAPEAGSREEADERRENSGSSAKNADYIAERSAPHPALTEN